MRGRSAAVKRICQALEKKRKQTARLRDDIRNLLSEFEELAENCDSAEAELDDAIRSIRDAADVLSRTV